MPLAAMPKCFLTRLADEGSMTLEEWVDMSATLDIDGLEFHSTFTPVEDLARLGRILGQAAGHGLTIPMMCHSPDFTQPDPAARQREIARQKVAIDASATLGGSYCRVLSGQRRADIDPREGIRWAAESIRECLPYAAERGITLNLENHYKDTWWQFPELAQKKEMFLALLDQIGDHPNFGVNYDPSNAIVAGDDPIEILELVKDKVVTMHASDRWLTGGATTDDLRKFEQHPTQGYAPFLKHGVIGQGLNDYDRIFSILREAGFKGWVSIEDGEDPVDGMDHLRQSAHFLRGKMSAHGIS